MSHADEGPDGDIHRLQEAFPGRVDDAAAERILGRERDGMNHEIERAPFLGDAFEHGLHFPWLRHIHGHEDPGFQLVGERLDEFARFFIRIRDCKFRA